MIGLAVLTVFIGGLCNVGRAEESQGPWHKVGTKVKETVEAVGEAGKKTYHKTKDEGSKTWKKAKDEGKKALETGKKESKGFWHSVKDTVIRWYEKAKAKVHSATAPGDEPGEQQKPASPTPSPPQ